MKGQILRAFTGFPQRLENLEMESGPENVLEKSWNIKHWQKVM